MIGVQCGTLLAGGLLGGIAGLLILHSSGMDFTASLGLTFIGFAAAIIFGIRSPLRCLAGGLAIGVIEALAAGYTSGHGDFDGAVALHADRAALGPARRRALQRGPAMTWLRRPPPQHLDHAASWACRLRRGAR